MQKKISVRQFSRFLTVLGSALCLLVLVVPTWADVIRMKNGQAITGKIVSYSDRKFVIVYEGASAESRAIIALDDIDSVEFDGRPLPSGFGSSYGEKSPTRTDTYTSPATTSTQPSDPGTSGSTSDTTTTEPPVTREPDRTTPPTNPEPSRPAIPPVIGFATVVAKEDWTYAKIDVEKGDRVTISADGTIQLGKGLETSPDGIESEDPGKLVADRPTGALIAVIGDDNDEFLFVGKSREFTAPRSGKLFLSVNENDLADNSGSYTVRIQVEKR